MKDSQTLSTLIKASKPKPVSRSLVCPECGGDVVLTDGLLVCSAGHVRSQLSELATQ